MEKRASVFEVLRAIAFAEKAHAKQVRKYSGDPYLAHPIEVAMALTIIPGMSLDAVLAAILHDVVEDCGISNDVIKRVFGKAVARLVSEVTERSRKDEGSREERKKIDRDWYAKGSPDAQSIKLADLISNTKSIMIEDPNFAGLYMEEKRDLLKVLTKGHPILIAKAESMLQEWDMIQAARKDDKNECST